MNKKDTTQKPIWANSKDAEAIVGKSLLERLTNLSEYKFREQMEGSWVGPISDIGPSPLMSLVDIIRDQERLIATAFGVPPRFWDISSATDITVTSAPCGNCGVYRTINNGVMEKCPNCGDDEIDLNEEIQIP